MDRDALEELLRQGILLGWTLRSTEMQTEMERSSDGLPDVNRALAQRHSEQAARAQMQKIDLLSKMAGSGAKKVVSPAMILAKPRRATH